MAVINSFQNLKNSYVQNLICMISNGETVDSVYCIGQYFMLKYPHSLWYTGIVNIEMVG